MKPFFDTSLSISLPINCPAAALGLRTDGPGAFPLRNSRRLFCFFMENQQWELLRCAQLRQTNRVSIIMTMSRGIKNHLSFLQETKKKHKRSQQNSKKGWRSSVFQTLFDFSEPIHLFSIPPIPGDYWHFTIDLSNLVAMETGGENRGIRIVNQTN